MIPVKIPDLAYGFINTFFIKWMEKNIGKFGIDWEWLNIHPYSISVRVKVPEKATLVALFWGGK
jgi:hypothetical protein